jgi:hypothetical protein
VNVRLGINPLTWSNDDMPALGAEIPLETCLREARTAGYEGVELGHKFPRDATELKPILAAHGLALVSGWYSARLLERDVDSEFAAMQPHLKLLLALGNPVLGTETLKRAMTLRDGKLEPLPEAEQEVKALGRLYGVSRSKVYVGAEAREDRVKSEASRAKILHFARHGILNNASPLYSHLALAEGGANEDGLLEAWELMQLDLQADLVVLSACETARGRVGAGEDMIGFSWAMFIAGVPSIVVSQWKVESTGTRDLMVNFHRALISPSRANAKTNKTDALREAALKLVKRELRPHKSANALLRREYEVLRLVASPHLVEPYELIDCDGVAVLVLEYLPHGDLVPLVGAFTTNISSI